MRSISSGHGNKQKFIFIMIEANEESEEKTDESPRTQRAAVIKLRRLLSFCLFFIFFFFECFVTCYSRHLVSVFNDHEFSKCCLALNPIDMLKVFNY